MKKTIESNYASHVAYTRKLEEYCRQLENLAQQVARLNTNTPEIGHGMLCNLVETAQGLVGDE